MEVIKKKISLYDCKSHVTGGLPYVDEESGETNFGKFVYDIGSGCTLFNEINALTSSMTIDDSFIRTCTLMNRYNVLLEILRNGLHLEKIVDRNCSPEESNLFGKVFDEITTYELIMSADVISYSELENVKTNIYSYIGSGEVGDYIIALSNKDRFDELGGIDLVKLVDSLIIRDDNGETVDLEEPLVPYVSVSVLFTVDCDDTGILTPYEDEKEYTYQGNEHSYDIANKYNQDISGNRKIYDNADSWASGNNIENIDITRWVIEPEYDSGVAFKVESKLQTLKYTNYTMDDEGNILPGVVSETDKRTFINGSVPSNFKLELPYKKGVVLNKVKNGDNYLGDVIISAETTNGKIMFKYVIGATIDRNDRIVQNTGIYYEETYNIECNLTGTTCLYGHENVVYKYDDIKYSDNEQVVYSEDFNLSRNAVESNITAFTSGDVWRNDGSVLNTPLFKEEYLEGVSFDSDINVNVVIDRGNATAFEKHLKFFECNSFDDVIDYSNGSFYN